MLPPLYAIVDVDAASARGWSADAVAEACLRGGARFLQVRAKSATGADFLALAERVVQAGRRSGAIVVVNDRVDVAAIAGASGVHVGQDDLPVAAARRLLGPEALVGFSTHTPDQVDGAIGQKISYLAVGPVFGTTTKETGYAPVGLELVRLAVARAGALPVVAIGGITLETAPDVVAAGAASVAVIGDLFTGGDVEARVKAYVQALRPGGVDRAR